MATMDAILRIGAKADTSGFAQAANGIRAIERAGRDASGALGGMGNILRSVTGGFLALGAGISAAGVAAFAKSAIDAADDMRDLSQKTGVSVEMLSRFSQAANMSGSSIEEVGKAMAKLSRGMVEAATTGKGPASEALQTLGISATDASGKLKTADQVMLEVSDRFAQMPDGAQKAALAMGLFGKSGVSIIPTLNEGRQAIEGLNATMSTEFSDQADAYNDSLAAMGATFGQIGMEIANQLLPYLASAVDWLTKVGIGFRDWIVANREPIRQTIEVIAKVGQALGPWVVGITALVGAYNLLTTALKAAAVAKAALVALTGPKGWAVLAGAAVAAGAAVYGLNQAMQATSDSSNQATLDAQKLAAEFAKTQQSAVAIAPEVDNAKQQQEAFKSAVQQSDAEYKILAGTIQATSQAVQLNQELAGATITAELAINSAAKQILQTKLGQARTEGEKIQIMNQIMQLELESAKLQKDAAAAQIQSEVTIADLKRRSAWAELRKAEAAIVTAAAHGQDTRQLRTNLELAKQAANAADREFVMTGKIADQKLRVADAQYQAMVYQARAAAQVGLRQAAQSEQRVQGLSSSYLSETNRAGGSVAGQLYRTIRTAAGGGITELLPAFAGGGYTGNGPRSGGMDGRGGFMAMLHPRETVIDHARASTPSITIQTGPIYRLPDGTDTVSVGDLQAAMQATAAAVMGQLRRPGAQLALGIR
jgi:TP901 family phage tail tape measure protein